MGGRSLAVAVIAGLVVEIVPGSATAQQDPSADVPVAPAPPKDPKQSKRWLAAAHELVQKGDAATRRKQVDDARSHYASAIIALEKALDAGDDVNLNFELASVREKLGDFAEAVKRYRTIVNVKANARADLVKKATTRIDELSAKVGMVTLTIAPDGTMISLGGVELGTSPLPESLVLMPGSYKFSFVAEGYKPKESELKVEEGSESERSIELEPVGKIIIDNPRKPVVEPPATTTASRPSKLPLYVGAGATIAFAGIATVTGILAVGQHTTYVAAGTRPADRSDAHDTGRRLAHITDACLGGAVIAGAFTAYWYYVKYRPAQRNASHEARGAEINAPAAKVDVVPWVQPGTSGVSIAGWF